MAVIAVIVWGLSVPLAAASHNCMTMSAMCDGPCGVLTAVVWAPPSVPSLEHVSSVARPSPKSLPLPLLSSREPPPKSVPLSA